MRWQRLQNKVNVIFGTTELMNARSYLEQLEQLGAA